MLLRNRVCALQFSSLLRPSSSSSLKSPPLWLSFKPRLCQSSAREIPNLTRHVSASKTGEQSQTDRLVLFLPPGAIPEEITDEMVLPNSNIVVGPYAGDSQIKEVQFVKSSVRAKDCPADGLPEFAILGRSNVGKSSLINVLARKKEVALTSKKPGKTQLINHFLVDKSWYIVDLPGYGFAKVSETARMDWSVFTKGYFLNREALVSVLLLIDAVVPPQKIDLDCANWLGRNNIPVTYVFTKCDKLKKSKGKRPDETIRTYQELIMKKFEVPPPWIMTSSVTGLGRNELLLHMSQLRNYWDN